MHIDILFASRKLPLFLWIQNKIMIVFKIGDRVEAIDDVIAGFITEIEGDTVTVDTEDGFPLNFQKHELVKIADEIQGYQFRGFPSKKGKGASQKEKPPNR